MAEPADHAGPMEPRGWPRRAGRWLWRAAALLFGLWLAWNAVSVQLSARAGLAGQGAAALALNPRSTFAASILADAALEAGHFQDAAGYAAGVAAVAPYTVHGVRTIGLARSALGDVAEASRWMGMAGALGWRDAPTQIWLADRLIVAGRYGEALQRLEALLRVNRDRRETHRAVNMLAAIAPARAAIVARLAELPPWREPFLTDADALTPADFAAREALIGDLRRSAAPPSRAELQPFVSRLVAAGEDARAYRFWLATVADRRWVTPDGLYDGGFDAAPDGVPFPFEWTIPDEAAAFVSIDAEAATPRSTSPPAARCRRHWCRSSSSCPRASIS